MGYQSIREALREGGEADEVQGMSRVKSFMSQARCDGRHERLLSAWARSTRQEDRCIAKSYLLVCSTFLRDVPGKKKEGKRQRGLVSSGCQNITNEPHERARSRLADKGRHFDPASRDSSTHSFLAFQPKRTRRKAGRS